MYTGTHYYRHIYLREVSHLSLHYPLTQPNKNDNSSTNDPTHAQQPTRRLGSIASTSPTECFPPRTIPSLHSLHLTSSPLTRPTSSNSHPLTSPESYDLVKHHPQSTGPE